MFGTHREIIIGLPRVLVVIEHLERIESGNHTMLLASRTTFSQDIPRLPRPSLRPYWYRVSLRSSMLYNKPSWQA